MLQYDSVRTGILEEITELTTLALGLQVGEEWDKQLFLPGRAAFVSTSLRCPRSHVTRSGACCAAPEQEDAGR